MQSANENIKQEDVSHSTNIQKSPISENSNDSGITEDILMTIDDSKSSLRNNGQEFLLTERKASSIEKCDVNQSTNVERKDNGNDKTVENIYEDMNSKNQVVNSRHEDVNGEEKIVKECNITATDEMEGDNKDGSSSNIEEETRINGEMDNEQNVADNTDDTLKEDEWLDILGSGQLKKKVLRKASNSYRPQNLQICEVNIEGQLQDGTIVEKLEHFRFQLGDNEVIQGLDLCVPLMDVGEESLLEVGPRFAYGSVGLADANIPCDATLTYRVELLSAENESDLDTLSVSERSKIGNKKRERGNWWYERENYTAAIQCYRRAVEYLDESEGGIQIEKEKQDEEISEENSEDVRSLLDDRLKAFNNLAAAQMKIRSYDTALESVEKVLMCQPKNVKALFRKGKILSAKGETADAIAILRQASQLEPESKTIKQELLRLLNVNKRETKLEKNMYKRMLGQNSCPEINSSKPSKFSPMRWGVVFGSIAAMVAGVVAYRYKFL